MRPPNTTFDVYLGGRLPPAAPDVSGQSGALRDRWQQGNEANKRDRTFFWTAVLEAPLGINITDAYPAGPGNTTLWVPDKNGDAYTVVFVDRERRSHGADFQRVYLVKGFLMAINVQAVNGSPSYSGVTTLLFNQDNGFVVSQPAANQARIDMQSASLTQVGIVSLSAQSLGAGAKYFSDKVGIGTSSPLANSALDVRGYTYAYFAGIIAFGGGNTPSAESAGAILQYDGSAGNKNISLTIAAADYASGMAGGVLVQGTNTRFAFRHKTASAPKYAFYNDDTSAYKDGVTGTIGVGATATGGLVTGLGTQGSTGGQIPVTPGGGGTPVWLGVSGGFTLDGNGVATLTNAGGSGITAHSGASITAAGTTQGTATAITTDTVNVTVPDANNTGVLLPSSPKYARVLVNYSSGAMTLNVYPPSGGKIGTGAINAPNTQAPGGQVEYWSTASDNSQWVTR